MTPDRLRRILEQVARAELSAEAAFEQVKQLPFEELGFAKVDHHRALRSGLPEVILGTGKTPAQIIAITKRLRDNGESVLITRLLADAAAQVTAAVPELTWVEDARLAYWRGEASAVEAGRGMILVVAAGTSDIPVAEEAALTAELMGNTVERIYDVGVAGLHRLLGERQRLASARVIIVVAGMEGALPSVIAGLVAVPVIAVPTSVGYGASFGGLAALLGMLNSCAAGVTVVNIDNGFGAGAAASRICRS
jgi:hypothetical protein